VAGLIVQTVAMTQQQYPGQFSQSARSEGRGAASGRDEDKIKKSELTIAHEGEIPYFKESRLVLICRKLYRQAMNPENFVVPALINQWYSQEDYHTMYVGAIEKILQRV